MRPEYLTITRGKDVATLLPEKESIRLMGKNPKFLKTIADIIPETTPYYPMPDNPVEGIYLNMTEASREWTNYKDHPQQFWAYVVHFSIAEQFDLLTETDYMERMA